MPRLRLRHHLFVLSFVCVIRLVTNNFRLVDRKNNNNSNPLVVSTPSSKKKTHPAAKNEETTTMTKNNNINNNNNNRVQKDALQLLNRNHNDNDIVLHDDGDSSFWWTPYVNDTARTYPKKWQPQQQQNSLYEWCLIEKNQKWMSPDVVPNNEKVNGMLYVKMPKASSSTGAGIHLAIAHRVAQRIQSNGDDDNDNDDDDVVCRNFNRHEFANIKQHGRRQQPSLLWTIVREPRARDLSHIGYFHISLLGNDKITPNILRQAVKKQYGKQTAYLSPKAVNSYYHHHHHLFSTNTTVFSKTQQQQSQSQRPRRRRLQSRPLGINPIEHPDLVVSIVKDIFQTFDFIGITERMEESLAVMTILWGLEPTDVIVLNAKKAGNYGARKNGDCVRIQTPNDAVLEILKKETSMILHNKNGTSSSSSSSSSYMDHQADFLLYATAQESLDRTIEALGVDIVQQRVAEIRHLQQLATTTCEDTAIYPCTSNGEYQIEKSRTNCYLVDSGCGYPCVDQVIKEYANTKNAASSN